MTVIPQAHSLIDESTHAVKLARYAQLIGLSEDQFFGLNHAATLVDSCHPIWTQTERTQIAKYLGEAQDEIEQVTHYPLFPKWFVNEQHYYKYPVQADWGKVVDAGFRNTTVIHAAMPLVYVTDPVAFFHATTLTDPDEIHIFHPNTEIEIYPSYLDITGGNVLVEIPWARLVKESYLNNPADGWPYADVPPSASSPYETTVDIVQVFNDTSIQAGVIWSHQAAACDACGDLCLTCSEYSETACIYVRNYETGALDVLPATYSGGTGWTSALCSACYCADPDLVRLNYRAGLATLPPQAEDAIIRLAHAKMPSPPCGCGIVNEMWTRDRNVPDVLTGERLNCPFGISDGAWIAWKFAQALRLTRGFAIG